MKVLKHFLEHNYSIKIQEIKKLEGYGSLNYKIITEDRNYVFKMHSNENYQKELLQIEHEITLALKTKDIQFTLPILPKGTKDYIIDCSSFNKEKNIGRLLVFVEGTFLGERKKTSKLAQHFGKTLASIDKELLHFKNPYIESKNDFWNLDNFLKCESFTSFIKDKSKQKIVLHFFEQYKLNILPQIPFLRKSIIHSDANDWNVLSSKDKITGIIDWGDMCYSSLINEIAIALMYFLFDSKEPIKLAKELVKTYHKILPLEEKEIKVLYYLIAARVCTSVLSSAKETAEGTGTDYISISEKQGWKLLEKWVSISPILFSNQLLKACGLKHSTSKKTKKELKRRDKNFSKTFSISYDEPIYMSHANFQYMFDKEGNRILDAYNNIIQVGHCHPKVVKAAHQQIATLNTNTRYLYSILNDYADLLLSKFPKKLNKVYFVNSGSAASDLAIRLARTHTSKKQMIGLEYGYHGNTSDVIEISHYKFSQNEQLNNSTQTKVFELPDSYKGRFKGFTKDTGKKYAQESLKSLGKDINNIAAFIAEPIVGCGGQIPLPPTYLKHIYKAIRKAGGLCISDEVQVGFGRLGSHYWGFEMQDVTPDIVILGKPIGNGHPLAAVVTTEEISKSFENGVEFFSSFGGNPVSCAIGKAVLETIEEENLQENALKVGQFLINGFKNLQKKSSYIGDVRGSGLFIGIEIVEDKKSKKANTKLAKYLKNKLRKENILVSTDGPKNNVIKIKPPLCFSVENAEELLVKTRKTLLQVEN